MAFSAPSGGNVFVPPSIARELTIDYARSIDEFAWNRYVQRIPVKKRAGYYLRFNQRQNFRALSATGNEYRWPDRQPRPSRPDNQPLFENVRYDTERFSNSYFVSDLEREQADADMSKAYSRMAIQQVMTSIIRKTWYEITNASWGANTASVATITGVPGAYGNTGTPTDPYLKVALLSAKMRINLGTGGQISGKDLKLVLNPRTAISLSASQEIHTYVKESPYSQGVITGRYNGTWGLPDQLYGHDLVVDDTVYHDDKEGASVEESDYVVPDGLFLLSRPGGLIATDGTTAKSTIAQFIYTGGEESNGDDWDGSEFSIEEEYLKRDRLTEGYVTWDMQTQVTSALGGFWLTDVLEPASS